MTLPAAIDDAHMPRSASSSSSSHTREGGQFALLAPELGLVVATAATSPPPAELRAQTDAVMALVGRLVQAAA